MELLDIPLSLWVYITCLRGAPSLCVPQERRLGPARVGLRGRLGLFAAPWDVICLGSGILHCRLRHIAAEDGCCVDKRVSSPAITGTVDGGGRMVEGGR